MADGTLPEHMLELRQVPALRALPPRVLAELAQAIEVEVRPRGASIMERGRPLRALSWLLDGRARWVRDGRALGDAEQGASIGLLEVLAGVDASADVIATGTARVARLGAERWFELLEDSFDLVDAVLSSIANELAIAGCRRLDRAAHLAPCREAASTELDFTGRLVRLRMSRPFVRAPIRALAVLAQRSEVRRWPRGAMLWGIGSAPRELVSIVSGEAREGRAALAACETVGLIHALSGRRHDAYVVARAPTIGIVFEAEALIDVLEDDDELALELLRAFADELLALGVARGLPPDVFGGAPDRSIARVLRVAGSPSDSFG